MSTRKSSGFIFGHMSEKQKHISTLIVSVVRVHRLGLKTANRTPFVEIVVGAGLKKEGFDRTANSYRILMRKYIFIFLISLICSFTISPITIADENKKYEISEPPGWVKLKKVVPDNSPLTGHSIRYHLVDRQIYLDGRTPTYFNHYIETPLNVKGVERASKIEIRFSPDYEKLILHKITVKRDGKFIDKLKTASIKLLNQESELDSDIYNGFVTAVLILKDIRPGDVLEQSFSIKGRNPILKDKFFHTFRCGWSIPVGHIFYRLNVPESKPLVHKVFGDDDTVVLNRVDERIIYDWERKKNPAYTYEKDSPKWYAAHPYIQFSEYKNWAEVKSWAESMYHTPEELSPELMQVINKIKKNTKKKQALIVETLKYVQSNIRYFGIEIGRNSHLARHPDKVFDRRFGDCKDKSLLLVSMLKKMGVDAYPALVSTKTGERIITDLPSPGSFNHVIVFVRSGYEEYWIDPTNSFQEGSNLKVLGYNDLGYALAIGYELNTLMDMSEGIKETPEISVEERFLSLDYFSPVELFVTSTYTKSEADFQRRRYSNNTIEKISRKYEDYYYRNFGKIKVLTPLYFEDDKAANRFSTHEHYLLEEFWSHREEKAFFNLYATTINEYSKLPQQVQRKSPLALYHPIKVTHKIKLRFPVLFQADKEIHTQNHENDYVKYSYSSYQSQNELQLSHIFERRAESVPVEDIDGHLGLLKDINDLLGYKGWAKIEESAQSVTAMKKLINRINQIRLGEK